MRAAWPTATCRWTPPGSLPLTGTRNNTFTFSGEAAPAPRAPRDLPSARPNLTPPPPPDLAEQAQRSEHLQNYTTEQDCRYLRSLLGGRWSTGFETRPCMVSFGDQVEITTRTDQTQRPAAVIYRAFHPGWPDRIPEAYTIRGISGRVGLPNQGVPRRGTATASGPMSTSVARPCGCSVCRCPMAPRAIRSAFC
ncbi:MAG: hypothetical protein HZY74_02510 [Brevundimonas sp.]|nr:MAG: hypothetical protein HZY74_02510 [Brevundimonas sp.]